jgi:predicted Rossmann-fold nucleotide-binding protein
MPIILVHEPFWRGLIAWCKERLVADGMIDENECGLVQVVNEPREVVDAIFNFYEKRGFEPSPAEREVLLNL